MTNLKQKDALAVNLQLETKLLLRGTFPRLTSNSGWMWSSLLNLWFVQQAWLYPFHSFYESSERLCVDKSHHPTWPEVLGSVHFLEHQNSINSSENRPTSTLQYHLLKTFKSVRLKINRFKGPMKVPMKALAGLIPPNRSLCLLSLLEVLPATRRLCRPCHIASSGPSSPPLPVCITQAGVISTALLIWCLTRLSLSETFPQLFLRNAVWLPKFDEIKSATFIQIIQSWVWRWLLHKMVKPLLIDALGTTQIFQIFFNLILAAVESQLNNSKTNSHNRNRRCPGAESSTNCCQRSASCVGFIPRTRMACPSRSAGTPDVWEKCANTASMEPMIWLNIMLSTLPTNKVPHRWFLFAFYLWIWKPDASWFIDFLWG